MNLAEIPLFNMLRGRLGYLGDREKVIAQNVANADTPHYQAEDLKPFSFNAKMQAAQGPTQMAVTQAGHMQSKNGPASAFGVKNAPDSEVVLSGNSVVLEEEMIKMSDARMNYDAAIGFYQKSLNLLRMAARPPGRGA